MSFYSTAEWLAIRAPRLVNDSKNPFGYRSAPGLDVRLGAAFGGSVHPNQILLQQVNGCGEKDDILHEERNVSGHCRKPGSRIPSIRHEGNDGDRGREREGRPDRAKYSQSLIPEAQEQERTEQPFRNTQEPSCPSDAKCGIEPENERSVADKGDQHLSFVLKPLLIAKGQEYQHHRRSDEMIVNVALENAGF